MAQHDPKKSQCLDFVEREWRCTTDDGGIAFRVLFGGVERAGKTVGERDARSLFSHVLSFCVENAPVNAADPVARVSRCLSASIVPFLTIASCGRQCEGPSRCIPVHSYSRALFLKNGNGKN